MLSSLNIKKIVYSSFAVFAALNIISVYASPVDSEILVRYNLDEFQYRILIATLVLPLIGIWACAAYGFVHYKQYALSIKGSAQGRGTNTIANGLGIIASELVISNAFSAVTSADSARAFFGGEKGVVVISTALAILFALAASFQLYAGAAQLNASLAKPSQPKLVSKSLYMLGTASLIFMAGIVFTYPTHGATESIYEYIPLGVALVGIWLPYLVVWSCYLFAVKHLRHYLHRVKGTANRKALGLLATGAYFILGSSVLIQLLGTLSGVFENVSLTPILIIIYPLIVAIGLGYLFIARAATELRRIES